MEVRFVHAFREHGVRWQTIRLAAERARGLFRQNHPFSTRSFRTDGRTILAELIQDTGETALLDLVKSQYAFQQVVTPTLYVGLEFAESGELVRLWPMGEKRRVVIDPRRAFGQPIVSKEGVPTSILANAFQVEESVERVARWFDVDRRSVRDAVELEHKLAA